MLISRIAIRCCVLAAGFATSACYAQVSHGYGFLGSTFSGPESGAALRYGAGGTGHVGRGIGIGGEIGAIRFDGNHGGVAALHLAYHFPSSQVRRGLDPFVLGGIAVAFASGESAAYAMVGGGIQYWFRPRLAIRVELRAYPAGADVTTFGEVRFGVAFR